MNARARVRRRRCAARGGWSIVEFLVVIFVVGDLLLLLAPWLDSVKEAERASVCARHLQRLGEAAIRHAALHQSYPSGGWGFGWLGDPDRGFGVKQPGGWMYSILPYIDRNDVWSIGAGINPDSSPGKKKDALTHQATSVVDLFYCPTRRAAKLYPFRAKHPTAGLPLELLQNGVVKSDFAINVGDASNNESIRGPKSYAEGDSPTFEWPDTSEFTGVSFLRSAIKPGDVTDGLSQTYLIGEKYVNASSYTNGRDKGDNEVATCGMDNDTCRTAGSPEPTPRQDSKRYLNYWIWGSAHEKGAHFIFCDGSVHVVSYQIDADVHRRLANRKDGERVGTDDWDNWISEK